MGYKKEVLKKLDAIIEILKDQITFAERIRDEDLQLMAGNIGLREITKVLNDDQMQQLVKLAKLNLDNKDES